MPRFGNADVIEIADMVSMQAAQRLIGVTDTAPWRPAPILIGTRWHRAGSGRVAHFLTSRIRAAPAGRSFPPLAPRRIVEHVGPLTNEARHPPNKE